MRMEGGIMPNHTAEKVKDPTTKAVEIHDYLKPNLSPELQSLNAFAKKVYAKALDVAVGSDVARSKETFELEDFVKASALSSVAVLRAAGALKTPENNA
jgi:hypothetical protein